MEKRTLQKLKEKLEKEKEKIEETLKKIAKKGKLPEDWEANFPHFNGESSLEIKADEVEEYEIQRAREQNLELKLKEIKLALEKIKKGNYGICEKCNKKIEIERLKILPQARFCKKCKEKV